MGMWHAGERGAYKIFIGKPEEIYHLQESKCRLEDDIKIYRKRGEPVLHVYGWVQGHIEGAWDHGNEALGSIEFGEFHD